MVGAVQANEPVGQGGVGGRAAVAELLLLFVGDDAVVAAGRGAGGRVGGARRGDGGSGDHGGAGRGDGRAQPDSSSDADSHADSRGDVDRGSGDGQAERDFDTCAQRDGRAGDGDAGSADGCAAHGDERAADGRADGGSAYGCASFPCAANGCGSTDAVPQPTATLPTATTSGDVVISSVRYDGDVPQVESDEYAVITNRGGSVVNLLGWRLNAGEPDQNFYFPSFDLQPGQSCRVYTNQLHPDSCAGASFGRGDAIWRNSNDCGYLYDATGAEVSRFCWN